MEHRQSPQSGANIVQCYDNNGILSRPGLESTLLRSTFFGGKMTLLRSTLLNSWFFEKTEKSTNLKRVVLWEIKNSIILIRIFVWKIGKSTLLKIVVLWEIEGGTILRIVVVWEIII